MQFSEDFGQIEGGTVCAFGPDGDERGRQRFGLSLRYERYAEAREELLAELRARQRNAPPTVAERDGWGSGGMARLLRVLLGE